MIRVLRYVLPVLLLAGLASAQAPFWKGVSADYKIEWSASNLRVVRSSGQPVLDVTSEAKRSWAKLSKLAAGRKIEAEYTYRLLSVVGSYLSLEIGDYCDCGGAHPTEAKRFRTIDLEHSSPAEWKVVSLTDLFPEKTVLAALQKDTAIRSALGAAPASESIPGLLDALRDHPIKVKDCEYSFPSDLLERFAFFAVSGSSVTARLSLPPAAEVCRGEMTQLGLILPQTERRPMLSPSAAVLTMEKRPKALRSPVTSIRFPRAGRTD